MLWLLATSLLFINSCLAASHEETVPLLDGRIVGGEEADILDYPYQVSLEYFNAHRCGGAIIARTWILSAAQCAEGLPDDRFTVRVGTSFLGIGGQVLNVRNVVLHSNYSTTTLDFDIALFQLEQPIALSRTAQIVRLPDNDEEVIEGTLARVAGWGSTSETSTDSSLILRSIEIPIFSHSACRDLYSQYVVSDRMICAGLWEGGKDACVGDGGSPLVSNARMIGIVSWGLGCARPQSPGVYTKVGAFRDWITEITGI